MHTDTLNGTERVTLPLPSSSLSNMTDQAVYARFMRYLRLVPNSRMEIKVLSAIQFTADMLDHSDAHVAKILVDLGLRAPRRAFPACFLEYADQALKRDRYDAGGPNAQLLDLLEHWDQVGEDTLSIRQYCLIDACERVSG